MLRTEDIFEEILRDHIFFSKYDMRSLQNRYQQAQGSNLICGDSITIYFSKFQDTLHNISFTGKCCSSTKASASIMADELNGQTFDYAQLLFNRIKKLISNEINDHKSFDVLIRKLCDISKNKHQHSVYDCVLLPWETMINAIQKDNDSKTQQKRNFSLYLY